MDWYANDLMGAKRAQQAVFNLRREPEAVIVQKMAGAVVCGFITEAEIIRELPKVTAEALKAAIENYRRYTAEVVT